MRRQHDEKGNDLSGDKTELVMLVGVPGCGKSRAAKRYLEQGYHVHSSDQIREELYGEESIQGKPSEVFDLLVKRVRTDLKSGIPCVIDATNTVRKRRMSLLQSLSGKNLKKTCVLVLCSPETCKKRDSGRARVVSEEVIHRMLCRFEAPYYYEGWDRIRYLYNDERYTFPRAEAAMFSQDNPHHTLTLGAHMDAAREYCVTKGFSEEVQEAAWYHDIGKLYTKSFMNRRGMKTESAHFYDHENYGTYLYLCEKASQKPEDDDWERVLYIANLINWHMCYFKRWADSARARERDIQLMGEKMFRDLEQLHEADRSAH